MPEAFVYQIYHKGSEQPDPGFRVLDNSSGERSDWFEYWPIRRFLLNETLQEDAFYGFLSPKFKQKTNLSSAAVFDFLEEHGSADIVLMTPSLHLTAYYWNVFQYGEFCHPGLLDVSTRFFRRIGQPTDLTDLVTHSRNEVYSNYMFAKPRFWRAWLDITGRLIAIAETPDDPLGVDLRKVTPYRGGTNVEMKIFVMERIPTWMLARGAEFTVAARDPFVVRSRLYKVPGAVVCDALKIAYALNDGQTQYRDVFGLVGKTAKMFSLQVRLGNFAGFSPIRSCLAALSSYWTKAGKEGQA